MARILILANSRKLSGRCVAGKNGDREWIRITKNGHNAIPVREARNYGIGQVVDVNGLRNTPSADFNYHTENYVYTGATVIGTLDRTLIADFLDEPDSIYGIGNKVSAVEAQQLDYSLLFVRVQNLRIYLKDMGQYGIKLRGQFEYNGTLYTDISVTDSAIEQRLSNVNYPYAENYQEAFITVSLGELFNGYAYKLIAGVIIP